jgi:5'-3' exoribonuclease 2
MVDNSSPIIDLFNGKVRVDREGKTRKYEYLILVPFIDPKRIKEAATNIPAQALTPEEVDRNSVGKVITLI